MKTMRRCDHLECPNPHYARGVCRKHYDALPERRAKNLSTCRAWHAAHPEQVRKIKRAYVERDPDAIRARIKKWVSSDHPKAAAYRFGQVLRSRLRMALRKHSKSGSAVRDLGCSIDELKAHLEAKFQPGMTWDNYGKGLGKWCIDHIIALDHFDLANREQLLKAVHYTNLQPLWWIDNCQKSNK